MAATESKSEKPNALLVGTGEYTTGYVHGTVTQSDKSCGVVGLTFFDLRARGLIGPTIALCGTSGTKFPAVRTHLQAVIGERYGLDVKCLTYPADNVASEPNSYRTAIKSFRAGDVAAIFTPDDTHFDIALQCINNGMHVIVTKPIVKTLAEHIQLAEAARKAGTLLCIEVHKRFDPVYADAVNRMRTLGDFGYFNAYMSQPKFQLHTFKSWAGKSSDISYYLNSHHVDLHCWAMEGIARPIRVTAMAATGVSKDTIGVDAEDTITLMVQWRNIVSGSLGVAVYTSSWAASKSDVHSQQRFHYMAHKGEITVDQAHRGAFLATDEKGLQSINPLYMRYTPDHNGKFVGQSGYGYKSFELFVEAANAIRSGVSRASDYDRTLATASTTLYSTAILEAGRRSLDDHGAAYEIQCDATTHQPVGLRKVAAAPPVTTA